MSTVCRNGAAALQGLRQAGSLKCLFPRHSGGPMQAVMVNTAGGVTGGDQFQVRAEVGADSALTLTTQTAERAYRARAGEVAQIATRLRVAQGARLNWLPQETILFEGCNLTRNLRIELETGASLLMVEPLIFGRAAMGETLHTARFHDRISILRDETPLYLDRALWSGDVQAQLDRPGVAAGARAMASVVYIAPDAEARLDPVRALLPPTAGASLLGDDMLVLRMLADDSFALRQSLIPLLSFFSPSGLPRCWML